MTFAQRVVGRLELIYDSAPIRTRCRCVSGLLLNLCQHCPSWYPNAGCRLHPNDPKHHAELLTDESRWCPEWNRLHGDGGTCSRSNSEES